MTTIDMTDDENILELYHRLSKNEQELNDILTIDDGDTKIDDLDLQLVEKLEWKPEQNGEFTFDIENNTYIIKIENVMPNKLIADFESGSLSNAWYGGTSNFDVTNTQVFDGDYSLDHTNSNTGSHGIIAHPNEENKLPNYPTRGNKFSGHYYYGHSNHRCSIFFGFNEYELSSYFESVDDGYRFQMDSSSNTISINSNGDDDIEVSSNTSVPDNEWFKFIIDFGYKNTDTIICSIHETDGTLIDSVSLVDEKYSGEGIAIRHNVNNSSSAQFWADELYTT